MGRECASPFAHPVEQAVVFEVQSIFETAIALGGMKDFFLSKSDGQRYEFASSFGCGHDLINFMQKLRQTVNGAVGFLPPEYNNRLPIYKYEHDYFSTRYDTHFLVGQFFVHVHIQGNPPVKQ
jgi:hypothetical protein